MGETDGSPEDHSEIMEATHRALCEHGYASVTMQDIASEYGKSKALLHYHFGTKADLMGAFIDHLHDRFEQELASLEGRPDERLEAFIDRFFVEYDEDDRGELHLALLELRAQAPYDEVYREKLEESDALVRETIVDIVREGIDAGVFRPEVDPEALARLVLASMYGARTRGLTMGDEAYARAVRRDLWEAVIEPRRTESAE